MDKVIPLIGLVRMYEGAVAPERMTQKSACYDVFCFITPEVGMITMYDVYDNETAVPVTENRIIIPPFVRALIPTGWKFKIPDGYSIRLHPRSGNALKRNITLPNCEGIIDQDYNKQTYVLLVNNTFVPKSIMHLERVCQLELSPVVEAQFEEVEDFDRLSDRDGGLGSTGV